MDKITDLLTYILQALVEGLGLLRQIYYLVGGQGDPAMLVALGACQAGSAAELPPIPGCDPARLRLDRLDMFVNDFRNHCRQAEKEWGAVRDDLANIRSLVLMGRMKYSREKAADRLGVSTKTLDRRIKDGQIACSSEGGRVFITEQAIRDYEDAQRRAS